MSQAAYGCKNQTPFAESHALAHQIHSALLQGHKAALNLLMWPAQNAELSQNQLPEAYLRQRTKELTSQGEGPVTCVTMAWAHLDYVVNRDGWAWSLKLGLDWWKHDFFSIPLRKGFGWEIRAALITFNQLNEGEGGELEAREEKICKA